MTLHIFLYYCQEYIIKREEEYPTPVYPSVVTPAKVHDLYNVIHTLYVLEFHCLYYLTMMWLPSAPAQHVASEQVRWEATSWLDTVGGTKTVTFPFRSVKTERPFCFCRCITCTRPAYFRRVSVSFRSGPVWSLT